MEQRKQELASQARHARAGLQHEGAYTSQRSAIVASRLTETSTDLYASSVCYHLSINKGTD